MVGTIEKTKLSMALVEVEAILNELSIEEYNKIPDEVIDFIDENKDTNYKWEYDYDKSLENQNLSEYTLEILAYINNEYLLNDEQKKVMEDIFELNDKKERKDVVDVTVTTLKNTNELFKHNKEEFKSQDNNKPTTDTSKLPIAINKKKNIFKNIVNVIKYFFQGKSK